MPLATKAPYQAVDFGLEHTAACYRFLHCLARIQSSWPVMGKRKRKFVVGDGVSIESTPSSRGVGPLLYGRVWAWQF